jgi:hypothetical protein
LRITRSTIGTSSLATRMPQPMPLTPLVLLSICNWPTNDRNSEASTERRVANSAAAERR